MITDNPLDYDRIQQEREANERRLDAVRVAIADREDRERAARLALGEADREDARRYQQLCRAAVASKAAHEERTRRIIGATTLEATQAALCDLMDVTLAVLREARW